MGRMLRLDRSGRCLCMDMEMGAGGGIIRTRLIMLGRDGKSAGEVACTLCNVAI